MNTTRIRLALGWRWVVTERGGARLYGRGDPRDHTRPVDDPAVRLWPPWRRV